MSPPEGCRVPVAGQNGNANRNQPPLERSLLPGPPPLGRDPRHEGLGSWQVFHKFRPTTSRLLSLKLGSPILFPLPPPTSHPRELRAFYHFTFVTRLCITLRFGRFPTIPPWTQNSCDDNYFFERDVPYPLDLLSSHYHFLNVAERLPLIRTM